MNVKINELEIQTWKEVAKIGEVRWSDWRDKFAELLIRECIAVHEDDYGVDIIGDVLKKHFGIE